MPRPIRHKEDKLREVIASCFSWADVCRTLNLPQNSGSRSHLKSLAKRWNISSSHFNGKHWAKGHPSTNKKYWPDILIINTARLKPEPAGKLRRALKEFGREHKCEQCDNPGIWNNKKLILQIDHKNGNRFDNRPDNIRFLCPNCHSQTDNWGKLSKK